MYRFYIPCLECEGWSGQAEWNYEVCDYIDCHEGKLELEDYFESEEDLLEDYPNATDIEEIPETSASIVPLVEDSVVAKQSDLKPYAWGTVERQMLELIDERDLPDVVFGPDAGVDNSTISSWRTRNRRPDLGSLYKIADHLGYKVRLVRDEY